MINTIILGHVLNVLPKLPAESVSCITTSPPYWGLRDYGIEPVIWDGDKDCKHDFITKERRLHSGSTKSKIPELSGQETDWVTKDGFCLKCDAWRGSLGLEPTFELYIKHLCDIFDEGKRVLRKDGTCFVNMGDSYWGGGQGGADYGGKEIVPESNFGHVAKGKNYLNKSLCDIPYRFSIEMINRGWIKRNTIIWHKPNCMPASADDRFTVDFEYLFFFTKNNKAIFWTNKKTLECVSKNPPGTKGIEGKDWRWGINSKGDPKKISFWTGHDYWFEQQFEEQKECSIKRAFSINHLDIRKDRENKEYAISSESQNETYKRMREKIRTGEVPQRNKRSVWIIPTQSFPEAHFAVYPEGLIETPIKAGCPEFVCKKCGKARVKILEPTEEYKKFLGKSWHDHLDDKGKGFGQQTRGFSSRKGKVNGIERYKNLGYTDCGCNAGFESGIVLDPFIGAGTTALVALKQRKRFIGIEIKQEYIDMSYKRIARVQQRIF